MTTKQKTLAEVPIGHAVKVLRVQGEGRIAQRLMEMGVVPGVSMQVIKAAPFGDPIQLRLLGYNLAVRRAEADSVEVEEINERAGSLT